MKANDRDKARARARRRVNLMRWVGGVLAAAMLVALIGPMMLGTPS